jgi:hypothetical protein
MPRVKKDTDLKANIIRVLDEIKGRVEKGSSDEIDEWADSLEDMLNEIRDNDGFGTEASTDPRGDGRNGEWSIWEMELGY